MSALAPAYENPPPQPGKRDGDDDGYSLDKWRKRRDQGAQARSEYESAWALTASYLQNRQWVGWDTKNRQIVDEPNPQDRERHTVNVLTPLMYQIAGKLMADDWRPHITFARSDIEAQAVTRQSRRAVDYAWEEELEAEDVLWSAFRKMLTFGTAFIRVKHDPIYGRMLGPVVLGPDGEPIFDQDEAIAYREQAFMQGIPIQEKVLNEGRVVWEAGSPYNAVTPPGLEDEKTFPWLVLERPVAIEQLKMIYGEKAEGLKGEDLRVISSVGLRDYSTGATGRAATVGKLTDHALLRTGYEMPCPEYPRGHTCVWAGDKKLEVRDTLPFEVNGQPKIGLVFLKWRPVEGRFWGLGLEVGVGPQRQRNRSRSQWIEMKDRAGLGRVYTHENAITEITRPKGQIFEEVRVRPGMELPKETQGTPPGPWLAQDVQMNDMDLDRATGIGAASRGEPIPGIVAYAAYALMAEKETEQLAPCIRDTRRQLTQLMKVTLAAIRKHWLPEKQIMLAGDDDQIEAFTYNASELPEAVLIKFGRGAPLPDSPAAETQKIFDIFDRAIASGQPLPLDWLYDSLQAGKAQPLPKRELKVQGDKAKYENMLLMRGVPVVPAPYDNDELHVVEHRNAQTAIGIIPGMEQAHEAVELHIQGHMASAQQKQQALMAEAAGAGGGDGGVGGQLAGLGPLMATLAGGAGMGMEQGALPPAVQ